MCKKANRDENEQRGGKRKNPKKKKKNKCKQDTEVKRYYKNIQVNMESKK